MTEEEARKVAEIMCMADIFSAEMLIHEFSKNFPEHTVIASEVYVTQFQEKLPEEDEKA